MTWRLALFGCISSLVVGIVYVWTAPMIEAARERARLDALYALAAPLLDEGTLGQPTTVLWPETPPDSLGQGTLITPILNGNQWVGMVVPITTDDGYSGRIRLLMAIDQSGRIVGLRTIEHRETPGLGDRIDLAKNDWILSFNGLAFSDLAPADWAVRPDGGQFDSFTGATITPRAVVSAVASTMAFLDRQDLSMGWLP
jgi:Na+-translocating ferredoxin:NAD+ oxidoreductase subunit G